MIILLISSLWLFGQPLITITPTIENTDIIILIKENSVKASVMPNFIALNGVLGVLVDKGIDYDEAILLNEIIERESGGNPNAKNPKSTAYGYCQFIDSTWNYVQKKWGIKLDRYNPEDQIYACARLLKEEGLIHWKASGPY